MGRALIALAQARRAQLTAQTARDNRPSGALLRASGFTRTPLPENGSRLSWRSSAPARFLPLAGGGFGEDGGGGQLLPRGGRWLLFDPVGAEGYADALRGLPAPRLIVVTLPSAPGLRLAALGAGCAIAALGQAQALRDLDLVAERRLGSLPDRGALTPLNDLLRLASLPLGYYDLIGPLAAHFGEKALALQEGTDPVRLTPAACHVDYDPHPLGIPLWARG